MCGTLTGRPLRNAAGGRLSGFGFGDDHADLGFSRRMTDPMPLTRPPPPNGTTTASKWGLVLDDFRADGSVARDHRGFGHRMNEYARLRRQNCAS